MGIPTVMGTESMLWSLAPIAENLQEIADRQTAITQLGSTQVAQYQTAMAAESRAGPAQGRGDQQAGRGERGGRQGQGAQQGSAAEGRRRRVAAMEGQAADLDGASELSKQLQLARNQQALVRWQTYLTELADREGHSAGGRRTEEPGQAPRPACSRSPSRARPSPVPRPWSTAAGPSGCCPAETIRAVNQAFSLLGKPYGVAATGPDKYGCLGAARVAWQPYTTLPNLVGKVYPDYQAVPHAQIQPGDLLVMGSKSLGLVHIGVALDNGEMIAADEAKGSVVVTTVPDNLYAALRPTLGAPAKPQVAPVATSDAVRVPLRQHGDVVQRRHRRVDLAAGRRDLRDRYAVRSGRARCGRPASTPARTSRPPSVRRSAR